MKKVYATQEHRTLWQHTYKFSDILIQQEKHSPCEFSVLRIASTDERHNTFSDAAWKIAKKSPKISAVGARFGAAEIVCITKVQVIISCFHVLCKYFVHSLMIESASREKWKENKLKNEKCKNVCIQCGNIFDITFWKWRNERLVKVMAPHIYTWCASATHARTHAYTRTLCAPLGADISPLSREIGNINCV